ncbi:unnamed protein product [Sphagnum balticum]
MVLKNRDPVKKDQNPFYDDPTRSFKSSFRSKPVLETSPGFNHELKARDWSLGAPARVGSNRARRRPARPGTCMGI